MENIIIIVCAFCIPTLLLGTYIVVDYLKNIKEILVTIRMSQYEMQKVELSYIDMHCKFMDIIVNKEIIRREKEKERTT